LNLKPLFLDIAWNKIKGGDMGKRFIFFIIISLFFNTMVLAAPGAQLYYHQGHLCDQIVFYCPQQLSVVHGKTNFRQNGRALVREEYVIKGCLISSDEVMHALGRINGNGTYCRVTKGADGRIKLVFKYDPTQVTISRHDFESIQRSKGIVFMVEKKNKMVPRTSSKPVIALDCGHGGKDFGTTGIGGVLEKDLALAIGKKVERVLRKQGYVVNMTRNDDRFISLDNRTTKANKGQADLFLSLHINYSPRQEVSGIETFCCNGNLYAPKVKMFAQKDSQSAGLGEAIQQSVVQTVRQKHSLNDRRCKRSVSQVLMGTQMPSALIELGFCSNPQESARLNSVAYQELLAQGISKGIHQYLKQI